MYFSTATILTIALVFLCILIIVRFFINDVMKPDRFPPGPKWLPIIGSYNEVKYLLSVKRYYYLVWAHLAERYGAIVGLKLGCDRVVVVTGYENIRIVLNDEAFEGRPDGFFFRLRSLGERLGVVFVDGPFMHQQRKFSLNQLRQFGYGKDLMNEIITKEATYLVDLIDFKRKLGPIQVHQLFDVSVLNTLWTLVAGRRFALEDKRLARLTELVNCGFRSIDVSGGILNNMPFLRFFAPSRTGYTSFKTIIREIMDFLIEVVDEHKKLNSEDFISAFLQQIPNSENDDNCKSFTEKQLLVLLEDLFMAGMETMSSTLSFTILYLLKHNDVQSRIHYELDEVIGKDRLPTTNDRAALVYLEATIMEIQRHANPVPITIPHRTIRNTNLAGYRIPENTVILPSLWSVHMDKTYWKDPENFRPSRFIDVNGKIIQHNCFMPYGIGRRRCIGEHLARNSIFLILSILLQKFKIRQSVDGLPDEILDGVTLSPAPFRVEFEKRFEM